MGSSRVESVLRVLYEDNHVIAVVKPARVPIQGDISGDSSLLELVKAYLKAKYEKPGNVFLGLVHRLDRPVSGVVVFAKTSKAASRLSESFRTRDVEKVYQAWVEGSVKGQGQLKHFLKSEEGRPVEVRANSFEGAKEAILNYRVLETGSEKSLLEITLLTGRKHQIRAQLGIIGHAILGDKKYGSKFKFREGEIALTAVRLKFPHPTKEESILVEL